MLRDSERPTPNQDRLQAELSAIKTFIDTFSDTHNISFQEILKLLQNLAEKENPALIPSYIFLERKLGLLEAVTKYLKEQFKLSYHQISLLLKRDDRVVWTTYNKAIKKKPEPFTASQPVFWIPIAVFTHSKLGPLESLSHYFHDSEKLSFNDIAKLLDRDNRTIWACYHKAKKKLEGSQ